MPFNAKCPGCGHSDPCGCSDPYSDKTGSDNVKYTGPNLPCTGILTCDNFTVAVQKIDNIICEILAAMSTTTTTSTSTTTAIPITTTTTTTAAPITTTTTTTVAPVTTTTTTTASPTTTTTTTATPTTTTTTTATPTTTTTTTTATPTTTTTTTATPTTTTTTTTECPTYYELGGCSPEDFAYTLIQPTLGVGQLYVLPNGGNPIYYTWTGASVISCSVPAPYNASIQISGSVGCPTTTTTTTLV